MNEILMNEHIKDEEFVEVSNNTIDTNTYLKILEHTGHCTYCANKFALSMEKQLTLEVISPPVYLEEEIRVHIRKEKYFPKLQSNKITKNIQLALYSMKIGFAVAVSIFMISTLPWFQSIQSINVTGFPDRADTLIQRIYNNTNSITTKMNKISNNIVNGGNE